MTFNCDSRPRCGECCGIVPIPIEVFNKSKDKQQRPITRIIAVGTTHVLPMTQDGCTYLTLDDLRCAIYDSRPEICRKYGTNSKLACPYFDSSGKPRTLRDRERTIKRNSKQIAEFKRKIKTIPRGAFGNDQKWVKELG